MVPKRTDAAANRAVNSPDATAMRQIIEYIRQEKLRVGDRLPSIRYLAATLGINRNAIRDGIFEAQAKGLVRVQPRSGVYLQSLDFSPLVNALSDTLELAIAQQDINLMSLLEARCVIEAATVEGAIMRKRAEDMLILRESIHRLRENLKDDEIRIQADDKFHLTVADMAGNNVLTIVLRSLLTLLRPFRQRQNLTMAQHRSTVQDHECLYRLILENKLAEAKKEIRRQIMTYQETLLKPIN